MRTVLPIASAERPVNRPAPPVPAPQPGPNFADLLQRGQATTHGVLARPAAPAPFRADPPARDGIDRDGNGDEAPTETQRAARAAAAKAKPAPAREKATPAKQAPSPSEHPASAESGEASAARAAAADAAPTAVHQAAELRDWLASLKLQEVPITELAAQELPAEAGSADGAAALSSGSGSNPRSGEESAARGGGRIAQAAGGAAGPALERAPAERAVARPEALTARDATPTLFSGASGAVPRGFDPGTLAPIALPTPLHSPDFPRALGAQVSILAGDGVQQAELHLNPAEMGPISVQIEIDGKEARVDFGADAAATRDVIERGLPELASALREQGLTLSGGGVFQRAPDQREQGAGLANTGRSKRFASTAAGAVSVRPAALPAAQGVIDLYV